MVWGVGGGFVGCIGCFDGQSRRAGKSKNCRLADELAQVMTRRVSMPALPDRTARCGEKVVGGLAGESASGGRVSIYGLEAALPWKAVAEVTAGWRSGQCES